jgi:hypothetical protein
VLLLFSHVLPECALAQKPAAQAGHDRQQWPHLTTISCRDGAGIGGSLLAT